MNINKNFIKILLKVFVTLAVIEVIYLTLVPFGLTQIAKTDIAKNILSSKTNAKIEYKKLKVKTHITPSVTIKADEFHIYSKEDKKEFLDVNNVLLKINILSLITKKLEIRKFDTDN